MKYSKSQLNAISRSITKKNQAEAREWLVVNTGIQFGDYVYRFDYKGSPCQLVNSIRSGAKATLANVNQLFKEMMEWSDQFEHGEYKGFDDSFLFLEDL